MMSTTFSLMMLATWLPKVPGEKMLIPLFEYVEDATAYRFQIITWGLNQDCPAFYIAKSYVLSSVLKTKAAGICLK